MIPLATLILATTLSGVSVAQDFSVKDLTTDIRTDLVQILEGTLKPNEECKPPQPHDVQFLLHTRSNINKPIILNASNPTEMNPNKKTIFIAHGWISGPEYIGIPDLKDAYLKRYDCNLIIVDWSKLAWQSYATAYCQLPEIGAIVAEFLCLLHEEFNIYLDKVHIVGHSMGGQLVGFIGQHTMTTCGQKVGRITGLDPAGFLYHGLPKFKRLDASDGAFVDVIHTNGLMFGYWSNCGDADFHVNCGIIQKGCPDFNITNVENELVATVICSHVRSLYYMAESINSDDFKAKSCKGCPLSCKSDNSNVSYVTMGEDCPSNAPKGSYWIPTKPSAPYAEGCSPYPSGCS